MEPSQQENVERIGGVVPCPSCDGRQPVDPFQKGLDGGCWMCGASGKIDPDRVCDCGRPARFAIGKFDSCGLLACLNSASAKFVDVPFSSIPKSEEEVDKELEDYYGAYGWSWKGMI